MDRATATELQRRNLEAFVRALGRSGTGSTVFQQAGVVGAVMPSCADRSIMNSVVYREPQAIVSAYNDLAAAMAASGVKAWTVWVHEDDAELMDHLAHAAHRFDGDPAAMVVEDLATFTPVDPGDLDWDREATPAEVGEVNDLAYGYPPGTFASAIAHPPADVPFRFYRARVDGEVASVLATIDVEDDCGVYFVATLREARGRALAARLLSIALEEARDRRLRTSTLQASRMGYPVYERLGYRTHFAFQLWERREPEAQ
jgi:GNAT superfamily N-acetyltransferase